jgi:hypothetical protein
LAISTAPGDFSSDLSTLFSPLTQPFLSDSQGSSDPVSQR